MDRAQIDKVGVRRIKRARAPFYVTHRGKDIALVIPGKPEALATIEIMLNKRIMKDIAEAEADWRNGRKNTVPWEEIRVQNRRSQKRRG